MKRFLLTLGLASLISIGGINSSEAQLKVGLVDMNRIFNSYSKTKEAEARINEAREAARKELEERVESLQRGMEDVNQLNEEIGNEALSDEIREQKARTRDEKIAELRALEMEINQFRSTREKQLQDHSVRMRNNIVEEITTLVQEQVTRENYDLVFDRSGASMNGVPILLYSKDTMDFSDDIIAALNQGQPR